MIGRKLLSSSVDVDSGGVSVTVKFKLTKADSHQYADSDEDYNDFLLKSFSSGIPNSTKLPIEVNGNLFIHTFDKIFIYYPADDFFPSTVQLISYGSTSTPEGKKVETKIVFNRQDGTQIGVTKKVVCLGTWDYHKRWYEWNADYQLDYEETLDAVKNELWNLKRTVDFTLTLKVIK